MRDYLFAAARAVVAPALLTAAAACAGTPESPVTPAGAATPPVEATADAAAPIIYFYGDSISTGRGFGDKDYPSPLNGIHGIANILLDANCASGAAVRSDLGQDFNGLYYDASNSKFRSSDFILWTNAGPTVNDSEMYRKWLELELFATQGQAPFILTTTYDHGGFTSYGEPLDSGQSLNDVVRQFAKDEGTLLLDWDRLLRHAEERVAPFGGSLLIDGIHPSVFGNFAMAVALLHYLQVNLQDLDVLPQLFSQEAGDVPDMTGPVFHWGYNPSRRQRVELLNSLIEDVQAYIEPGPAGLICN